MPLASACRQDDWPNDLAELREDAACCGAATRTQYNAMGDMEECIYCRRSCRWDLVENDFFGFKYVCKEAAKRLNENLG